MRKRIARTWTLMTVAGCLSISGCFGALERGFSMIYSPEATSNLLSLPQSGLLPLAEFFARWVRG